MVFFTAVFFVVVFAATRRAEVVAGFAAALRRAGADAVAATHKTFAYLHGLPVPLDEVWSWVGDRPVDVTVIRDEKDCAAQAAKREAQLELEKRLEEVGALFGVDDRHAHRGRGGPPPPEKPWFARSGPSAAAASELGGRFDDAA